MSETVKSTKKKTKIYVRTKRFTNNRLLQRKQFIVEVDHPGRGTVPKREICTHLARMFFVQDVATVVVFGFRTKFGGGKSTGYGLVYDNLTVLKKIEPTYRLIRAGMVAKTEKARKQRKEKKNRMAKFRGLKKITGAEPPKKKK
eukprot:NODE_6239_length_557_cov_58.483721_g6074_i0.p1 GENE.NODE_6239_length_557_cov_58.483721_g6074_i0~~NODE_6239_length_557_cov_58.483721_g6074_i0.p1  ORF type:complete len:144 (-),score=32.36 NODE_6239_length_557_cov_58.483721_g6074_i0:71-502(-)